MISPRSAQPVSDAALCAQTLGLRKLRRSVTRLEAQVALRFAPLRRWRSLHLHGAPPAPPDASLVTPCSVPPSASWNLRALPNSGEESAPLKCSHNQLRSASCPCGEADAIIPVWLVCLWISVIPRLWLSMTSLAG